MKIDLALARLGRLGVGGDITVKNGESREITNLFGYVSPIHYE